MIVRASFILGYTSIHMKRSVFCTVFLGAVLIVPAFAYAAPVIRTGETVSLKEDQSVPGDFYVFGGQVTNSAKVGGDSYVAAGEVTQNGEIVADLSAIVGRLFVHAPVGDDVRVVGGQVTIADRVEGDVVVLGGELTILSTAEIGGDVMFYGGALNIEGTVRGSVFAKAETIRIDARVLHDVDATAGGELVFGAHADIGGNVAYKSSKEAVRALDSVIVGSIVRDESIIFKDEDARPSTLPLLIMLFSSLVARFLYGTWLSSFFVRINDSFGSSALIGFSGFILLPIAIILTLASVLGSVIGLALLCLYFFLLSVSWGVSGMFLGGLISRYATGTASYSVWWIVLGTLILYAVTFIPHLGMLAALIVTLMVFGGFILRIYEHYK